MMRVLIALVLTCGVAAADELPIPPLPPVHGNLTESAPVPDFDARAPAQAAPTQPKVAVRMYRSDEYNPSLGFTPGSRYQSSEDRKPIQTPGLSLSVPLQ